MTTPMRPAVADGSGVITIEIGGVVVCAARGADLLANIVIGMTARAQLGGTRRRGGLPLAAKRYDRAASFKASH